MDADEAGEKIEAEGAVDAGAGCGGTDPKDEVIDRLTPERPVDLILRTLQAAHCGTTLYGCQPSCQCHSYS